VNLGNKTFKREFGAIFVAVLCYQIYQGDVSMVEVIVWPFITFIAAASGLHIYDKNFTGPNASGRLQQPRDSSTENPDK
jgi:hypothetical protein